MRIVKEAYTDHCKVVCAPDYVTIERFPTPRHEEPIHISREEANELIAWLSGELGRVLPEVIKVPQGNSIPKEDIQLFKKASDKALKKADECDYVPSPRSATQTVPLTLGDPSLAYQNMPGRGPGDGQAETMDLAELAQRVGKL